MKMFFLFQFNSVYNLKWVWEKGKRFVVFKGEKMMNGFLLGLRVRMKGVLNLAKILNEKDEK